ncbi:MAG: alpha-1,2-fucosyltransferase [Patescibacteria group bacterium]|nr:alpha-1,2-fucosyltransferase [Patescibacteria group bacterium]
MLTLKLKGGLGNQMFQYATSSNLAKNKKTKINFDLSFFSDIEVRDIKRDYLLDKFNISADISFDQKNSISGFRKFLAKFIVKFFGEMFYYRLTSLSSKYLDGYFQSEKYFKNIEEDIRKDFTLKNEMGVEAKKIEQQIVNSKNSVSLHIRRGDYVSDTKTNVYHGICDLAYYESAIKYLGEKIGEIKIFVFSDDIDWVKENLQVENMNFVSSCEVKDYEELILMGKCEHNIIANSTFSWWGAWLNENKNKIVIAPKKWFNNEQVNDKSDIVPKAWIRL